MSLMLHLHTVSVSLYSLLILNLRQTFAKKENYRNQPTAKLLIQGYFWKYIKISQFLYFLFKDSLEDVVFLESHGIP